MTVNQQVNGGQWNLLGSFAFTAGAGQRIELTDQANGYVIADAVKLVPEGAGPNRAIWPLNPPGNGTYQVYAKWTANPNRATDAKYTVHHSAGASTMAVNQQQNGGQWNLLGSFALDGASYVELTDIANGYVIADAIRIVANSGAPTTAQALYLHGDHEGTPRLATDAAGTVVWRWDGGAFGETAPNNDPDGDGNLTTINLRYPGQYFDSETGLHYNWNRYYDPKTGRFITADPRSVGKHVENMLARMNVPKLLRSVGVTVTPDVNGLPLELNPYVYAANNPLRWTDPTGKGIETPIIIIGGACFTAYCAIQANNYCKTSYPSSGGLENDRKRLICISERLKFCVTFGAYIMDPIGSGTSTAGEETGKKMCKECEQ